MRSTRGGRFRPPGEGRGHVGAAKRLPDALADGDPDPGRTVARPPTKTATPSISRHYHGPRRPRRIGGAMLVDWLRWAHGPHRPIDSPAEVYGNDGPCALASVKHHFGHT